MYAGRTLATAVCGGLVLLAAARARAETDVELAQKTSNPVSDLISVPLQSNFECCIGSKDAFRYVLNIQPVVPVSVSEDWTVIVRTILPIQHLGETAPGAGSHTGFGDITQSFFVSPAHPKGLIWGVGPAFLWPIGDKHLAAKQWAAGPTFVVLKQQGPVTVGLLANHLWSYARDNSRDEVNSTFMQPFFAYAYRNSTTISINTETSYDWAHKQWTVPINAGVSHIYKFDGHPVQLAVQGKFYAVSADGPQAGLRFTATFLFPK